MNDDKTVKIQNAVHLANETLGLCLKPDRYNADTDIDDKALAKIYHAAVIAEQKGTLAYEDIVDVLDSVHSARLSIPAAVRARLKYVITDAAVRFLNDEQNRTNLKSFIAEWGDEAYFCRPGNEAGYDNPKYDELYERRLAMVPFFVKQIATPLIELFNSDIQEIWQQFTPTTPTFLAIYKDRERALVFNFSRSALLNQSAKELLDSSVHEIWHNRQYTKIDIDLSLKRETFLSRSSHFFNSFENKTVLAYQNHPLEQGAVFAAKTFADTLVKYADNPKGARTALRMAEISVKGLAGEMRQKRDKKTSDYLTSVLAGKVNG